MNEQNYTGRIVVCREGGRFSVSIRQPKDAEYWVIVIVLASFWFGITISSLAVFVLTVQTFQNVSAGHKVGLVLTCGMAVVFFGLISYVLIWKVLGREQAVLDDCSLTLVRDLRLVRWKRTFALSEISNISWRERRVARKGGSFVRRTIAFDIAGKTMDLLHSQLSYPEANRLEALLREGLNERRGRDCRVR